MLLLYNLIRTCEQLDILIYLQIHEIHTVGENRPLLVVGFSVITSTRKKEIKRATEKFHTATNQSQPVTVYASQMDKPCFSNCSSKIKAASPLGSLKKFLIASTLPVLPTSWLAMEDLGRLGKTTGCFVCGEPTKWECVHCRSVQYCGKYLSCLHASGFLCCKRLSTTALERPSVRCRAISSGTWHTVVLDRYPANTGLQTGSILSINRYDDLQDKSTTKKTGTGMPPNT